ncbi:MAG: MoaD/ThiS family protein [Candidatus Bathyarchaeia archaeon]
MYPNLVVRRVEKRTTLRDFMKNLGEEYLYAFDRGVLGVMVNDRAVFPEAELKVGDRVVVFPVVAGG